jgi:hypothetical protein
VRLVGNDQVEETDVERLVVVDQALVDADVDAGVELADVVLLADDVHRLFKEVVEGVLGLLAQLLAVTQEKHALDPSGFDQQFGQ